MFSIRYTRKMEGEHPCLCLGLSRAMCYNTFECFSGAQDLSIIKYISVNEEVLATTLSMNNCQ
jgi:hypothetical protein